MPAVYHTGWPLELRFRDNALRVNGAPCSRCLNLANGSKASRQNDRQADHLFSKILWEYNPSAIVLGSSPIGMTR